MWWLVTIGAVGLIVWGLAICMVSHVLEFNNVENYVRLVTKENEDGNEESSSTN